MREFNVTGNCNYGEHYMVDISSKLDKVEDMVVKGRYFTINRARQYGKTTTIKFLAKRLKDKYIVLRTTFEGLSDVVFENDKNFNSNFIDIVSEILIKENTSHDITSTWSNKETIDTIKMLGNKITNLCSNVDKEVVLIIDEVDKSCNHKLFLDFLGMLRAKYLERDETPTFYSVILVGVHDIKNIRYSGSNQNSKNNDFYNNARKQDSPWNIAAKFDIDMSFSIDEIDTMLIEYDKDHNTGMDIFIISSEIYKYTNGYPFLVSNLCKIIDEDLNKDWTIDCVKEGVKLMLVEKNTLFDDLFKNLENNTDLYNLVYDILIVGLEKNFEIDNPTINLGATYGIIINKNRKIAVANKIFETRIYNYFISKDDTNKRLPNILRTDVAIDNKFNMELTLKKFSEHYTTIYNNKDISFLERHCRLIFLTYLKPLINGVGFYNIESETLDARRMDIVLDYGTELFIIELKIWHGESYLQKAFEQLDGYLNSKNEKVGYLITFNFNQNKELKCEWVEYNGRQIFSVIV